MSAQHRGRQASDLERDNEQLRRELADKDRQIQKLAEQVSEQQRQIADAEKGNRGFGAPVGE
jgi:predicted RNase H-like nuclease (RuvC/YqgF family)